MSSRLIFLLLVGLMASACDRQKAEAPQAAPAGEAEATGKGVDRSHKGEARPDVPFVASDGSESRLTDRRGPLLVNFWATWCAPCVKELPTLAELARSRGANGALAVIAMNQDPVPQGALETFFVQHKIDGLGLDQDPKMEVSGALKVQILPTTILYGADGKEVWRYTGDLDWTGPEAAKLLAEAAPSSS